MFGLGRLGSTLSVLDFSRLGSALSVRSLSRFGSALSIFGISRLGARISVLDFSHLGSTLSVRGFTAFASDCRVDGTGGELGFNVEHPFTVQQSVRIGSSLSVFGWVNFGSSLSVVDFLTLGASVSLRSFARLGSSVSVLRFAHVGSTLSLRSFSRLGSSLSVLGNTRMGSHLSVHDCLCIKTGNVLSLPGSFSLAWDSVSSEIQAKVGTYKPLAITATGGSLHGTWSSESIISASDRRLKREVLPLVRSLRGEQAPPTGKPAAAMESASSSIASSLLRLLIPKEEEQGPLHLKTDRRAAEALPGVVRPLPGAGEEGEGKETRNGISHQDLLAVITLAAKERQQRLDALEAQEAAEEELHEEQRSLIEVLTAQVKDLSARFSRLRYRHPRPPRGPLPGAQ